MTTPNEPEGLVTRRHVLTGSAALLATPATLPAGPSDAGIDLVLRPEPALVLAEGVAPVAALRLAGPDAGIRLRQGQSATLRFRNEAPDATGFTICGLRGWGAVDAPATRALAAIAPGASASVALSGPDSGTSLIRATPSPGNAAQRGAVGVLVVEEANPPSVDHDLVLMLEDWLLGADGKLRFGSIPPPDAVSRVITVNGHAAPERLSAVPRARIRLRLVNASTQRVMLVGCDGVKPSVVAVDGQPSELFVPAQGTIPIGPGACFDLMADLPETAGQDVRVVLRGTERLAGALEPDRSLLLIRTDGTAREARPPIAPLPPNPALPRAIPLEAAKRLDLIFADGGDDWSVNGKPAGAAPRLTVRQGDAVTLGFFNPSPLLVPLRVQGQAMRVLHALDDGWDPYWRDTVLLPARGRTHVAFVASSPGLWPIESGFDDQLLRGLRCAFLVKPR